MKHNMQRTIKQEKNKKNSMRFCELLYIGCCRLEVASMVTYFLNSACWRYLGAHFIVQQR